MRVAGATPVSLPEEFVEPSEFIELSELLELSTGDGPDKREQTSLDKVWWDIDSLFVDSGLGRVWYELLADMLDV